MKILLYEGVFCGDVTATFLGRVILMNREKGCFPRRLELQKNIWKSCEKVFELCPAVHEPEK